MNTFALLLATALLAGPATVFAHGSEAHDDAPKAAAVKEQKPWGIAGDASAARRTITLDMSDNMRFTPERISVKRGETVRLRVANKGQVMHEIVLGTPASLDEHAQMMLKFPTMEHGEPYMAHVSPGKSGDLVWNFNREGSFDFACLIPGHYQAGMRGTITVTQ
ncbi:MULTISPECIES: cupredoxin domain-containing protein [unclassified Delftia]|uniref:cupredoxin domain-containing protein n=1 Tax=unclassified Delftia TaxID=2613839 RepID=UPI0019009A5A|nr:MULTISPECIES: cupredoxin family protein [unclassified Delftia]MBK0112764.1 cupredoxin family protein [Delftia sp. S65]MBK0119824.1 cupredoxin family protein [Delftia sp. S67]MBK0131728.1 cupredoxin family protein [Delftia sp. S66]